MIRSHHVAIAAMCLMSPVARAAAQEPGASGGEGACDSLCITPTRTISFETSRGTQMNVDISPDGETLLFDLLGDLYTVPRSGGAAHRLTRGPALDLQPVYSPDGRSILFVSDRSGNENLWLVDADGSNPRPVTTERGDYHFDDPEWSPDGDYILVRRNEAGSPNAGRQPWLIHVGGGVGMELDGDAEGLGFRWGPEGRYVYFRGTEGGNATSLRGNSLPQPAQIMRLDRHTSDIAAITRAPSGAARPAVSPDGTAMVYVADIDAMSGLRLRNLSTDEDDWLAFPIDREHLNQRTRFVFAPDGEAVVFVKDGTFHEVDVRTKEVREIPFVAAVEQDLGPLIQHDKPFRDDSLVV
ncbi:MAG: hypothetical protein OEO23_06510, partial [Gemmatimonadota bacterium]|nr:hypothetical protein [Gemmatimonadota bacterium]